MTSSSEDTGTRCRSCGVNIETEPVHPTIRIPPGYCPDCIDAHGHPMSYEEVFDRLVKEYIEKSRMDVASAERAADERMWKLPAWTES